MRALIKLAEGRFDDENAYVHGVRKSATDYAGQVWYHGSEGDFDAFRSGHYYGMWFAENPKLTGYYGPNQYKVRLHMKNPLIVSEEEYISAKPNGPTSWARKAEAGGHDAVIIQDIIDGDTESTICGVIDGSIIEILDKDIYQDDLDEDARLPLRKGLVRATRGEYAALLVVMDPSDFIRLTTPRDEVHQIYKDKFALSVKDYDQGTHERFNKNMYGMPYLIVTHATGQVEGHEGRHRAAMVAKEGGKRFPCVILFRTRAVFELTYSKSHKWDDEEDTPVEKQRFAAQQDVKTFIEGLEKLNHDANHDYWYSNFDTQMVGRSKMRGSPRSNHSKWEYDAWKPEDMPDQLIGQYDPLVVVPKSHMKVGVVKGYNHYK